MQMTDGEVVLNIMQAKDQKAQISICADLNCCSEERIKDILKAQGVDLRTLKSEKKKHIAESKSHKPRKKSVNAEKKSANGEMKTITLPEAMAAIRAELDEINRQQYELDMRKADLFKQLWDMLGGI
jgi:fructose-1,6-bisphosphatase